MKKEIFIEIMCAIIGALATLAAAKMGVIVIDNTNTINKIATITQENTDLKGKINLLNEENKKLRKMNCNTNNFTSTKLVDMDTSDNAEPVSKNVQAENYNQAVLYKGAYDKGISYFYKLDGKYNKFTGTLFVEGKPNPMYKTEDAHATIVFKGDGRTLNDPYTINFIDYSKEFDINVAGVEELEIYIQNRFSTPSFMTGIDHGEFN